MANGNLGAMEAAFLTQHGYSLSMEEAYTFSSVKHHYQTTVSDGTEILSIWNSMVGMKGWPGMFLLSVSNSEQPIKA